MSITQVLSQYGQLRYKDGLDDKFQSAQISGECIEFVPESWSSGGWMVEANETNVVRNDCFSILLL